jgi:hypothetical protein
VAAVERRVSCAWAPTCSTARTARSPVGLATYAREDYNSHLSIAYISLIDTENKIVQLDQMLILADHLQLSPA